MATDHIYSDLGFSDDFEVRQQALDELSRKIDSVSVDTKEALSSFVPSSDSYQQRVIEALDRTIRLVAPAGSGKTQTIINRVITRIQNGVSPRRILVLTFDTSAAASLRTKLSEQSLRVTTQLRDLRISTLNSFGYGLLRDYVPSEYKNVIEDIRQRSIIREGRDELKRISPDRSAALPTNLENRFYREFYSLLKNQLFDPRNLNAQHVADFILERTDVSELFFSHLNNDRSMIKRVIEALIWLFKAYELALKRDNLLDFDDQKLRAHISLREAPQLLASVQSQFAEVIIDEFQDINTLDFEFIKALAANSTLLVTGDDDQAIYGFRGCSPDYLIDLEKHLGRQVVSYELQINYRCPRNIVEHADRLIRNNRRRILKTPIAHNNEPSDIKVIKSLTAGLEAKAIVAFIRRVLRSNKRLRHADFAVLYRTNAQSLPLQIEFILNDIPYYVRKQDNILYNDALAKLLAVLRVKHALSENRIPKASDRVLTIQAYFRFVNSTQVEKLENLFRKTDNFADAISSPTFVTILPKARDSKLVSSLQECFEASDLIKTLDVLAKRFNGLKGMIGSLEDVINEQVPLGELYDIAASFKGSIPDFIETIERALERARLSHAGEDEMAGVALLTYFKAKGLQWHTVILTTCNEGVIPHKKAPTEDERRLFYVAMTRASSNLVISYLKSICKNAVSPSRFISEAGLV